MNENFQNKVWADMKLFSNDNNWWIMFSVQMYLTDQRINERETCSKVWKCVS